MLVQSYRVTDMLRGADGGVENIRKGSLQYRCASKSTLEKARKCSLQKLLAWKSLKTLAAKPPGIENARTCSLRSHGVERVVEKEIEKDVRNPTLEDTSLEDASLRALNARAHSSLYINRYV